MPVLGTTAHTSAGPRPPLADRLTPAQWLALDVVAAVLVALWVVFDLRLRHGFRFELPAGLVRGAGRGGDPPSRGAAPLAVVAGAVATLTGGLIAGSFGGWRAARLRPAAALARVA